MLLPDNIHPELSVYYNGALILDMLQQGTELPIMELYQQVRYRADMSFPTFVLSLDWLYLIDMAHVDEGGVVRLCS